MQKISYFNNEQGDITITLDEQPVAITKSEEFAALLVQLQFQLNDYKHAHECTRKLADYMQGHKDAKLGANLFNEALVMVKERDAIVAILKLRR